MKEIFKPAVRRVDSVEDELRPGFGWSQELLGAPYEEGAAFAGERIAHSPSEIIRARTPKLQTTKTSTRPKIKQLPEHRGPSCPCTAVESGEGIVIVVPLWVGSTCLAHQTVHFRVARYQCDDAVENSQ